MFSPCVLLKLVQRARTKRAIRLHDGNDSGSDTEENPVKIEPKTRKNRDLSSKCRVCLQNGFIPIYGDDNYPDISGSIESFTTTNMTRIEGFPELICDSCHKLLEAAQVFRKTAQETDVLLRQSQTLKSEPYEDFDDWSDGCYNIYDDVTKSENDIADIKDSSTKKFFMEKKKKKFHCKTCFMDFKLLGEYYDHLDSIEHKKQKASPNVQCGICDKTLKKNYMKQHLDLHKTEKLYKVKCKICKQQYRKGCYKEHLETHESQDTKYICEVCGRSFRRRNVYRCHLQTHTSDFPFKCQFCPYRGRNSGLLKIHVRTHTGDYRYQCSECSARFLTSSNLNRHMAKHNGRNYQCDTCTRRFYSKHELEQHFKVDHMGIKEHVCNLCGKAFGYRNAMKKHQLHVHKREKFIDGKGRMPSYLQAERKKQQEGVI